MLPEEKRKLDLEIQKLELEIIHLRRPTLRQPSVIFGVIGALVAMGTLWVDNIDTKSELQNAERDLKAAERQIQEATRRADELRDAAQEAERRRDAAQEALATLDTRRAQLEADIAEKDRGVKALAEREQQLLARIAAREKEIDQQRSQFAGQLNDLSRPVGDPVLPQEFETRIEKARSAIPPPDLNACDQSASGLFVAVGQGGTVMISTNGEGDWMRRTLEGALLVSVDASDDGQTICTGAADGRIFLSRDRGNSFAHVHSMKGPATVVGVSPRGRTVAARTEELLARSIDGGASWEGTALEDRPVPSDSLLPRDDGRLTILANRADGLWTQTFAPPDDHESGILALTFDPQDLDHPQIDRISSTPGRATAMAASGVSAGCVSAWNPFAQVESRGELFVGTLEERDRAGRWRKLAASRVPHIKSLWSRSDAEHFVVITTEGALVEAQTNLLDWRIRPGTIPPLADVSGAADGSVLWAVGQRGTILRRTSGRSDWDVIPDALVAGQ